MMLKHALAMLLFCGAAQAADTPAIAGVPYEVETGTAKPSGHYSGTLHIVLGLTLPHKEEEERFLEELQDQSSPNFHRFLTSEEWNARFAPSAESEQAVVNWAEANGFTVTNRFANRLIVDLEAPAPVVEKAFGVTINSYEFNGETDYSNDRIPTLPTALNGIVSSVEGLNNIQRLKPNAGGMQPGR